MVAMNVGAKLRLQLRGERCRALTSGMRLRTLAGTHHLDQGPVAINAN